MKRPSYRDYLDVEEIDEDLITFFVISRSSDKIRMIEGFGLFYLVNDFRNIKYTYVFDDKKLIDGTQEQFLDSFENLMISHFINFERGTNDEV